jgi:ectoine hydroxylase-related dioxygenase (phytanoyl-CoA dioxygenase family)
MTGENGATQFIRGSHKISDEEARKPFWREVDKNKFSPEEMATAQCPAGSAIFFDTKLLHAAGHNRSARPRRTIQMEWVGENSLPVSPIRYAFQGLKPRSRQPAYAKQIRMAFPHLFQTAAAAK